MDKYDEQSVDLNIKLYELQTEISQLEDSLKAVRTVCVHVCVCVTRFRL